MAESAVVIYTLSGGAADEGGEHHLKWLRELGRTEQAAPAWIGEVLPAEAARVPSMLPLEERQYLYWLTTAAYEGWGAVVDLGPWLGSSTMALAAGLRGRGLRTPVDSFDLFVWQEHMEAAAPAGLAAGADFRPLFDRETAPYAANIDARRQDLRCFRWDRGPVEILHVDAAESWELTNAILRGFAHALQPQRSRVVVRNFRYYGCHWLPLIFDSRPDLWEPVEGESEGTAVTFRPLRPLPAPAGVHTDYSEEAFPPAAAEPLLRARMAREPEAAASYLKMIYRNHLAGGDEEAAGRVLNELRSKAAVPEAELRRIGDVAGLVVQAGWRAYDKQEYTRAEAAARRALRVGGERDTDAKTLLAFAGWKAGRVEEARQAVREILSEAPGHVPALLASAEFEIGGGGRAAEAEARLAHALPGCTGDEGLMRWGLDLLGRAGAIESGRMRLAELAERAPVLRESAAFRAALAKEQQRLERAVRAVPRPSERRSADARPAGFLPRAKIPSRPEMLQRASLAEVAAEVSARAAGGAFTGTDGIHFALELQEKLRTALAVDENRFSAVRHANLVQWLYRGIPAQLPAMEGATVLDLGCGSLNPFGFAFTLLMMGARRGIAVDLDEVEDWGRALRVLAELAGTALVSPRALFGDAEITREQILRNIASFDLSKLQDGDAGGLDTSRLEHRMESAHALPLERGEADLVFTTAFFEHIPAVEEAIAELARVTRPGGAGVHIIDCSDHRRYHDGRIHALQFLTDLSGDELVHGSNRLRPSEFAPLFERNGFEVLHEDATDLVEVPAELRAQLAPRFRALADEQVAPTTLVLAVRRR